MKTKTSNPEQFHAFPTSLYPKISFQNFKIKFLTVSKQTDNFFITFYQGKPTGIASIEEKNHKCIKKNKNNSRGKCN